MAGGRVHPHFPSISLCRGELAALGGDTKTPEETRTRDR